MGQRTSLPVPGCAGSQAGKRGLADTVLGRHEGLNPFLLGLKGTPELWSDTLHPGIFTWLLLLPLLFLVLVSHL